MAPGAGASIALRYCTATTLAPAAKNGPKLPEELGRSPRIQPPPCSWTTTGVGLSDGTRYTSRCRSIVPGAPVLGTEPRMPFGVPGLGDASALGLRMWGTFA